MIRHEPLSKLKVGDLVQSIGSLQYGLYMGQKIFKNKSACGGEDYECAEVWWHGRSGPATIQTDLIKKVEETLEDR